MSSLDTQARSAGGLRRELSATLGGRLQPLQCYGKGAKPTKGHTALFSKEGFLLDVNAANPELLKTTI